MRRLVVQERPLNYLHVIQLCVCMSYLKKGLYGVQLHNGNVKVCSTQSVTGTTGSGINHAATFKIFISILS
jgi:hypothetical protein